MGAFLGIREWSDGKVTEVQTDYKDSTLLAIKGGRTPVCLASLLSS